MMAPRKGIRHRLGRRKRPRSRQEEVLERTRAEARALSRQRRIEARRRLRAEAEGIDLDEVGMRLRGLAFETRRRLRPVLAPFRALFASLAPYITRTLLFVIQLIAGVVLLFLELSQVAIRWIAPRVNDAAIAVTLALERYV